MRPLFICILFLFCLHSKAQRSSNSFIPDEGVKRLALKYDNKYFPLFLESLNEIKNGSSDLIGKYMQIDRKKSNKTQIKPLENMDFGIVPVYGKSNLNIPDHNVQFPVNWICHSMKDYSWHLYFQSLTWTERYFKSENTDTMLTGFKVINDWIMSHVSYPDKDERHAFNEHATAERLKILIKAYNRLKISKFDQPEFEQRLLTSILGHLFFAISLEKYSSWDNHAIIMDNSMIESLIQLPDFKLQTDFIQFVFKRIFEMYRYSFTLEGVHKEHSTCYHLFVFSQLDSTIKFAKNNGITVPDDIIDIWTKANKYLKYISENGHLPAIGDCNNSKTNESSKNKRFFSEIVLYPESGWGLYSDSILNISLIFQSDFFSHVHYQQDETSFILSVDGNNLIIDPGLYSYTTGTTFHKYVRSAAGHNLLIVDNKDFNNQIKDAGLSGITRFIVNPDSSGLNCGVIEMTHPHYNKIGVSLYRQIAFNGSNTIGVKDTVTSDTLHHYSQLYHFNPGAAIEVTDTGYLVSWNEHPYFLLIRSNRDSSNVVEGSIEPVQGWYSPAFNKIVPAPVLILKKTGKSISMLTTIEIGSFEKPSLWESVSASDLSWLFKKIENIEQRKLTPIVLPEKWVPSTRRQ